MQLNLLWLRHPGSLKAGNRGYPLPIEIMGLLSVLSKVPYSADRGASRPVLFPIVGGAGCLL